VLAALDVTIDETRAQVARIVGQGDEVTSGQIPFTPRAKKVLELALREGLSLGHNYIGTEHILLGIARASEGVGARILLDHGLDAERVRDAVLEALGGTPLGYRPSSTRRRRRIPRFVAGWLLGAATLGAGILIGWAIWG
jgi:ATP-dependent Clp protease ATP-binding subunit ClpC